MATVNTVTGPVDVAALGATLMHEHVFTFHSDIGGDYPWTDEPLFVDGAVDKLTRLREAGVSTIVDLTVFWLGRNVARVARIAERARFNVIAASGLYTYSELPGYFSRQLAIAGRPSLRTCSSARSVTGSGKPASVPRCLSAARTGRCPAGALMTRNRAGQVQRAELNGPPPPAAPARH